MEYYQELKTASAFNPALQYVISIAKLLDVLDACFLRNEYLRAYKTLIRIYERVEHKLTQKESEEIQTLLDKAPEKLRQKGIKRLIKQENFCNELINIEKKLKRDMDKYKLIMPSKEDPRFAVLKR